MHIHWFGCICLDLLGLSCHINAAFMMKFIWWKIMFDKLAFIKVDMGFCFFGLDSLLWVDHSSFIRASNCFTPHCWSWDVYERGRCFFFYCIIKCKHCICRGKVIWQSYVFCSLHNISLLIQFYFSPTQLHQRERKLNFSSKGFNAGK